MVKVGKFQENIITMKNEHLICDFHGKVSG